MIISFLFFLYGTVIWDPSGQAAYGLTHMGPIRNSVALPLWVHMGSSYGTHIGMFAGWNQDSSSTEPFVDTFFETTRRQILRQLVDTL